MAASRKKLPAWYRELQPDSAKKSSSRSSGGSRKQRAELSRRIDKARAGSTDSERARSSRSTRRTTAPRARRKSLSAAHAHSRVKDAPRRKSLIQETADAKSPQQRRALRRRIATTSERKTGLKIPKSRQTWIEQAAAAKSPEQIAAVRRRAAKSSERPREQDAISRASDAYQYKRYLRGAKAEGVRRKMDAENEADRRELNESSKAKLRPAGIDLNLPVRGFKVLGDTALATAGAFLPDKEDKTGLKHIGRTLKGGQEALFGIPAAALGIGTAGVELAKHGKSKTGGRLLKAAKEDINERKGASWRNEPGALKAMVKRQNKEGSFAEIAELAGPLGGTASVAAGVGVRTLAKAGIGGKPVKAVARATTSRPKLRTHAGKNAPAETQKVSRGLVGGVARAGLDARRRSVQKKKVADAKAGRKPLEARRQHVKEGEVAPLRQRTADKAARRAVAKDVTDGRRRGQVRIDRELTDRKGGPRDTPDAKTLRQNTVDIDTRLKQTALKEAQVLGIGSSAGARAILPGRIEAVKAARDAAPRRRGETPQDNLPELEALLKDPAIFDDPKFQRVVDTENTRAERMVGDEQGIGADRKRAARYQPLEDVLGIKRKVEEPADAYQARVAEQLGVVRLPDDAPGAFSKRLGKAVEDARAKKPTTPVAPWRRPGETVSAYTDRLSKELGVGRGRNEGEQAFRGRLSRAAHRVHDANARQDAGDLPLPRERGESAVQHIDRVAAAAEALGLKAPGFRASRFNDADSDVVGSLDGAPAAATSANARENVLFREGRENPDPQIQEKSLAKSVRDGEYQKSRDRLIEREGTIYATRTEAEAAAAALKDAKAAPLHQTRTGMAAPSGPPDGNYSPTSDWVVLPKAAVREWEIQNKPVGPAGRALDKAQGLQSAVLLGASLSWAQFQVVADGLAGAVAGGLHRAVRNNRMYRNASDEFREHIDVAAGGNPANDAMLLEADKRMGTLSKLIETIPGYAKHIEGRPNPLTALLRADAAKSTALRRSAIIQRLAVDERTLRIDGNLEQMGKLQRGIRTAATKADPAALEKYVRANPRAVEAHGEYVNKVMGDFATYTKRERDSLRRFVPFYGYLRYSTRLMLYTMPLEHPALAGTIASIGQMGAEDAKDFVGDDLPFGLTALFNEDGSQSMNWARAHPGMNALTQATSTTQLIGLGPAVVNIAANAAFQRNLFLDKGYKVDGIIKDNNKMTPEQRARVAANEMLSMLGIYRDFRKADNRPQGSDSLVGSRRLLNPRSAETRAGFKEQEAERKKAAASGSSYLGRVLESASPLTSGFVDSPLKEMGKRATKRKTEDAEGVRVGKLRDKGRKTLIGKARADAEDATLEMNKLNDELIPDSVKEMVKEINDDRLAQGLPPLPKRRR